jgi:hypothetical protein
VTAGLYGDPTSLQPWQAPWAPTWESDPAVDNGHAHRWRLVHLTADGQHRRFTEDVVRCDLCHAPRCGDSTDPDPCMERRHHPDLHIHFSGRFRPVGDLLPEDQP